MSLLSLSDILKIKAKYNANLNGNYDFLKLFFSVFFSICFVSRMILKSPPRWICLPISVCFDMSSSDLGFLCFDSDDINLEQTQEIQECIARFHISDVVCQISMRYHWIGWMCNRSRCITPIREITNPIRRKNWRTGTIWDWKSSFTICKRFRIFYSGGKIRLRSVR